MLGPSGLAPLALRQLAAWQEIASAWPRELAERDGQQITTCGKCGQGLWLLTDTHGSTYRYRPEQEQAMIVLHLRARHAEMEPAGL